MTKEKTTFKIGDIVTINHGSTYSQQIGKITSINRLPHPYRSDDKLFTWYRIEYSKYINLNKIKEHSYSMRTCDTSILEHFDVDEYIESVIKKKSEI